MKAILLSIFALVLTLCMIVYNVAHADATFTWTPPTTREDGSPLAPAEIAGYKLEWTLKGVAQPVITVPPGSSYALVAPVGRVCATLVTVDTDGLESLPSNQACKNSRPSKPGNFAAK